MPTLQLVYHDKVTVSEVAALQKKLLGFPSGNRIRVRMCSYSIEGILLLIVIFISNFLLGLVSKSNFVMSVNICIH